MIPSTWRPYRRDSDDELVGYLTDDGTPMSLIGLPLGDPGPDAEAMLSERGLAALDGRWLCRIPNPLPPGRVDATRPAEDWPLRHVVIVEAGPDQCRVRPLMPHPEELDSQATLPVPVHGLLSREE